jgi:hypothetical protein
MNPTKTEGELHYSGMISSSCNTNDTCSGTVKRQKHNPEWKSYWMSVYIINKQIKHEPLTK